MSIECGECESDLRGGHDISCSRYNLIDGIARAMMKADGRYGDLLMDEEFEVPKHLLQVAKAALVKVLEVQKARKYDIIAWAGQGCVPITPEQLEEYKKYAHTASIANSYDTPLVSLNKVMGQS